MYLRQLWQRKDDLIESLLQQNGYATASANTSASNDAGDISTDADAAATTSDAQATEPEAEAEAKTTKEKSTKLEKEPLSAPNRITASISAD